jgi:YaiO family outer membrane protein
MRIPPRLIVQAPDRQAVRWLGILPIACLSVLFHASSAHGQSMWAVDLSADRSDVQYAPDVDEVWDAQRIQLGFVREGLGGWFLAAERQERAGVTDSTITLSGYRRMDAWTISGGAGIGPSSSFLYRESAEGEISRRVVGTLVASGGYRYLHFSDVTIDQVMPAATYYHARGEAQARVFLTRNRRFDRTTTTVLLRAVQDVHPRVRLSGGAAYGDRIFDVASLADARARAWVGFGGVRLQLSAHDFLEIGGGAAQEAPSFEQRSLHLGYRRTF